MGKFSKEQWKQKLDKQKEREKKSLSEAATDPRFEKALSDPKFRNVGTKKLKIKIDDRFKGMFKDPKFQITSKYDARGREINRKDGEHLKKFYDVEDEEEDEVEQEEEEVEDEDIDEDEEDEELDQDEDEEEDVDQEDNEEFENDLLANTAKDEQAESVSIGDASRRLAVLNCDWDRLKAVDLFVLFSSFLPTDGIIKSVTIYPSEYGMEQLKKEDMHGPEGIFLETAEGESEEDAKPKHVVRDQDSDEEDGLDPEKLRDYELQRLKYYFAVVECDSVETGQVLYTHTDGTEIESTANVMDVRYIPDDITFSQPARDVATSIPVHYKAPIFQTKILQHTKPDCSWDTTDSHRLSVTQANVNNENLHELEEQYKNYIASDSEDESDSDNDNNNEEAIERKKEKVRNKYKALLDLIQPDNKEAEDMEITFTPGIADTNEDEFLQPVNKKGAKNGKPAKKKDDSSEEEEEEQDSDFDHYDVADEESKKSKKPGNNKRKKKRLTAEEEKQQAELELMAIPDTLMGAGEAEDDKKKGYNLKTLITQHSGSNRKKRKLKKMGKEQDEFTVDLKDDRFSALFDKPDFAVDPTDKRFKSTKNADIILKERVKRRAEILMKPEQAKKNNQPTPHVNNNNKNDLSSLIESVKKKTQLAQQKQKNQLPPPNKKIKFDE